jgi:hypothetical protein
MKTVCLLFALGLAAGVRAAPVPRTQALTRNVGDKLYIRDCTLVRRGDWGDDGLARIRLPHPELERASRPRAREDPERTKILKAKRAAYQRDRLQRIAQDPALAERLKIKKATYDKCYRDRKAAALAEGLVTGSPSEQLAASRRLAEARANKAVTNMRYQETYRAERQALTEALVTGSPSTRLAAARFLAEARANRAVRNKRYYQQCKKAKQQALTPFAVVDPDLDRASRPPAREDPDPTKTWKAERAAYQRNRRQRIAQDPTLAEKLKIKKAIYDKFHRDRKAAAITEGLVTGSPSEQLAASRLAEAKAKKSATNKDYQQASTQAPVTDPVGPSTQTSAEAASSIVNTNKSVAIKYQRWKKAARGQAATQPLVADPAVGSRTQSLCKAVLIATQQAAAYSEAAHPGAIHQAVQPTHQKAPVTDPVGPCRQDFFCKVASHSSCSYADVGSGRSPNSQHK